jgi:hypothetical protein
MLVRPFTPTLFPPPLRGRVSLVFPYIPERFFIKLLTISKSYPGEKTFSTEKR